MNLLFLIPPLLLVALLVALLGPMVLLHLRVVSWRRSYHARCGHLHWDHRLVLLSRVDPDGLDDMRQDLRARGWCIRCTGGGGMSIKHVSGAIECLPDTFGGPLGVIRQAVIQSYLHEYKEIDRVNRMKGE